MKLSYAKVVASCLKKLVCDYSNVGITGEELKDEASFLVGGRAGMACDAGDRAAVSALRLSLPKEAL